MLWSASWNDSTRSRPRSFAALQAISAVASACESGCFERERDRRDADAGADLERSVGPRLRQLGRACPDVLGDAGGARRVGVGQVDGETVAGDPRGERTGRAPAADDVGDLGDHLVADVHAEVLVDHVQLVEVDVDDRVALGGAAPGDQRGDRLLERGPGRQAGRRVETRQQDRRHLAGEQFGDARLPEPEVVGVGGAEQREEAHHAVGDVPHRCGHQLVRRQAVVAADPVDDHRALLQLRPAQQVTVRARDDAGVRRAGRVAVRPHDRDALLRDDQRAERAVEVIDGRLHEPAQLVGVARVVGLVDGSVEQQVEVAVTGGEIARHHAERRAHRQLALQALERRAHEAEHERERPRVADCRRRGASRRRAAGPARRAAGTRRRSRRRTSANDRRRPAACPHPRRHRLDREPVQVRVVLAVRDPQRRTRAVVDRDALRARQQHADQLTVGIEVGGHSRRSLDYRDHSTALRIRTRFLGRGFADIRMAHAVERVGEAVRISRGGGVAAVTVRGPAREPASAARTALQPRPRIDRPRPTADLEVQLRTEPAGAAGREHVARRDALADLRADPVVVGVQAEIAAAVIEDERAGRAR
jgi:hypothetical protein